MNILFEQSFINILKTLAIFVIVWFLTYKKFKNAFFSITFAYSILGILFSGVYYILSKESWLAFTSKDIQLYPFLYCFILLFILTIPFLFIKIDKQKTVEDFKLITFFNLLSTFVFIISIPPFIEGIYRAATIDASSMLSAYEGEGEEYSFISSLCIRVRNYFQFFICPLIFYYIWKSSYSLVNLKKYIYFNLFSFITSIILSYAGGGRGTMVNILNYIVICYALFYFILKKNIVKKISHWLSISLIIVVIGLGSITLARASEGGKAQVDNNGLAEWISLYLGQGPLEFDRLMYPSTVRTDGDNSFSLIKTILGKKTFKDNDDRRDYWEKYQEIPNYIFYTVIGDIYSDLGESYTILFCILVCILMSVYFKAKFKKKTFSIQTVIVTSIYFEWITMGFMTNCFKTYYSQFFILFTIILLLGMDFIQRGYQKEDKTN